MFRTNQPLLHARIKAVGAGEQAPADITVREIG